MPCLRLPHVLSEPISLSTPTTVPIPVCFPTTPPLFDIMHTAPPTRLPRITQNSHRCYRMPWHFGGDKNAYRHEPTGNFLYFSVILPISSKRSGVLAPSRLLHSPNQSPPLTPSLSCPLYLGSLILGSSYFGTCAEYELSYISGRFSSLVILSLLF